MYNANSKITAYHNSGAGLELNAFNTGNGIIGAQIFLDPGNKEIVFSTNESEGMVITSDGTVGIGTSDIPIGCKLAIKGKVITEEVKVELQGNWPDYVFENDYELPSQSDVEKHIDQKGHLIDIPNAKEVAENGVLLGEMDAKLLQKIEELALYTIEQEKILKSQSQQIENQAKEIEDIKEQSNTLESLKVLLIDLQKRINTLESK